MAAFGFRGLGWFLSAVVAAPACYIVSSQVAAERARVEAIDRAIVQARKDIRMLETEFDTRASLAQLERWNGEVLALTAPRAGQYVPSEAALGALRDLSGSDQPQLASMPPNQIQPGHAVARPENLVIRERLLGQALERAP